MIRILLVGLAAFMLAMNGIGLYATESFLGSFLTLNQTFIVGRLTAAACVLIYALFRTFRIPLVRNILGIASLASLGAGTAGMLVFFLMPMDIFIFLVFGIYGLLARIELEQSEKVWLATPKLSAFRFSWPSLHMPKAGHIFATNKVTQP